jgi:hypothetical protein
MANTTFCLNYMKLKSNLWSVEKEARRTDNIGHTSMSWEFYAVESYKAYFKFVLHMMRI